MPRSGLLRKSIVISMSIINRSEIEWIVYIEPSLKLIMIVLLLCYHTLLIGNILKQLLFPLVTYCMIFNASKI